MFRLGVTANRNASFRFICIIISLRSKVNIFLSFINIFMLFINMSCIYKSRCKFCIRDTRACVQLYERTFTDFVSQMQGYMFSSMKELLQINLQKIYC